MKIEKLCLSLMAKNFKLNADIAFLSKQLEIYRSLYLGEINKNIDKEINNVVKKI